MASEATKLQDRIVDAAARSLEQGRDAFISGPTGCGKTRMFSRLAQERARHGDQVLVLAHRRNLITQSQNAFARWSDGGLDTSYGMDGRVDQSGQIVYCTIQTAHEQRENLIRYDAVVIDEAHHARVGNHEYRETIEAILKRNPDALLVPTSATPPEGYEGLLPRIRDADKHIITFEEAVAAKLVDLPQTITPPMLYQGHERIDDVVQRHRKSRTSATMEAGIGKELAQMRGDDWAEQLVSLYGRHLADRRTLGFFENIKEANAFVAEATAEGYAVAAIHSRKSDGENEFLKEEFKQGRLKALVSVDMISEGYDIDCDGILLDKRTTSATEYKQIIGRQTRSHGTDRDRKALLVDTGASTHIHGEIAAQAAMQTVRGEIERRTMGPEELLPGASARSFSPWVEVKTPADRPVWATSLDGRIVYAAPTPAGYAAFESRVDRKGARVDLLAIEGERKGMPRREALGGWLADAVRRNEKALASLFGQAKAGTSELVRMVGEDWKRNASSIERSIGMLTTYPAASRAAVAHQQGAIGR